MNAKPSTKPAPLGRGLSALFGDTDSSYKPRNLPRNESGSTQIQDDHFREVPVHKILEGSFQARRHFDEDAINELAESIRKNGIIQPLILRSMGGDTADTYEIIAGERRWRAAQKAGLHKVPAIIRDITDRMAMEIGLIENVQREDLSPIEEAEGYQRLIEEFEYTQEKLASELGKSRPHITNTLRLLKLPDSVKSMLLHGEISMAHARTVITADDPEALAKEIIKKKLSVRQAEALAKKVSGGRNAKKNDRMSKAAAADPNIMALERDVGNALGLKINIHVLTNSAGTLTVHYNDLDQLEHVLKKLQG